MRTTQPAALWTSRADDAPGDIQQADTLAPLLTTLFLPDVDVMSNSQTVTFFAGATDVGTGVAFVQLNYSPATPGLFGPDSSLVFFNSIDSFADGISSLARTFGSGTPAGVYTITSVRVQDTSGNATDYTTSQLAEQGFDTSFTVTSFAEPDITAPLLTSLLLPDINVMTGSQTVIISAGASDLGTGVAYVRISYSPSTPGTTGADSSFVLFNHIDPFADGGSSLARTFGSDTPAGIYTVTGVRVEDAAGNATDYTASELAVQGFETSFTVTSAAAADTTAPRLTNLTLPDVDVASGSSTVTVSVGATDVGTGVAFVIVSYSPSTPGPLGAESSFVFFNAVDSFADGASSLVRTFGGDTPSGTYTVTRINVADTSGNAVSYTQSQLAALGFDTRFTVTGPAPLAVTASVTAPTVLREGSDGEGIISVTVRAITTLSGSLTMSLDALGSTASEGSDFALTPFSQSFAESFDPARDFTFTLPAFSVSNDQIGEGQETVAIRIRLTGQTFANGADTIIVTILLIDNDLHGTDQADTLIGTAFADELFGQAGDDDLSGGPGRDILAGGPGADTFRDTAAGLDGDLITDWAYDDRIVIGDATLSGFSAYRSGNVVTFTGGALTLATGPDGQLLVAAAPGGGVQVTLAPQLRNDFSGDGRSDLVWRHTSGEFAGWLGQPDGSFIHSGKAANPVDNSWRIVGTSDFNGDGRDDLLWRHSGGALAQWLGQSDGGFVNNGAAASVIDMTWTVAGTSDFNGDGRGDIVWLHTSGAFAGWLGQPDGSFVHSGRAANPVDTSWRIVATGDFDGDGAGDLVWRHTSGEVAQWLGVSDGSFVNNGAAASAIDPGWTVLGAGDFNGDGRDDILLRNTSGQLAQRLGQANGSLVENLSAATARDPAWKVAAIADYNGDGRDDLIWRHANGGLAQWLGQADGSFADNAVAATTVGADWVIQSPDLFIL